jgi:hypothetical protein
MKLLGMLLPVLFLHTHPDPVLLVDTGLKKPVGQTENFTVQHYLQRKFPVYADDLTAINKATDKVAKMLSRESQFNYDTVFANRTVFVLNTTEEYNYKLVTVRAVTLMEDSNTSFDFELVSKESNSRKAQKKVLDFANYLEQ